MYSLGGTHVHKSYGTVDCSPNMYPLSISIPFSIWCSTTLVTIPETLDLQTPNPKLPPKVQNTPILYITTC